MKISDSDKVVFIRADASKHYNLVYKMFVEKFSQTAPMSVALGSSPEDMNIFFKQILDNVFTQNYSILAFIEEECIGFAMNFVETNSKKSNENLELNFDGDLTEEIAKNRWGNLRANALAATMAEASKNFESFIPDSKAYLKLRILYVDPEKKGKGIGTKLVEKCIEIAKENNCDHLVTVAAASASAAIFNKLGFKIVREITISSFRENGKQIFSTLLDGCQSMKLMILKVSRETIFIRGE